MIINIWRDWKKTLNHAPNKEEVMKFASEVDKLFEIFWYKEN